MHVRIVHEDNKDHKCVSCDKSFSQAHHLKRHFPKQTEVLNRRNSLKYIYQKNE